jgi:hypothetical protein
MSFFVRNSPQLKGVDFACLTLPGLLQTPCIGCSPELSGCWNAVPLRGMFLAIKTIKLHERDVVWASLPLWEKLGILSGRQAGGNAFTIANV